MFSYDRPFTSRETRSSFWSTAVNSALMSWASIVVRPCRVRTSRLIEVVQNFLSAVASIHDLSSHGDGYRAGDVFNDESFAESGRVIADQRSRILSSVFS
jgi:hypothetical protein